MGSKYCNKTIISDEVMLMFDLGRPSWHQPLKDVTCHRSAGHRGRCSAIPKKATVWKGLLIPVLPYNRPAGILKGLRTLDNMGMFKTLKWEGIRARPEL
jgi:hypothetical protein